MRIVPISQQNLNKKPYVKYNQPNFNGVFRVGNPEELAKVFTEGSMVAKVLDIFQTIVEKATDKSLTVEVHPTSTISEGVLVFSRQEGTSLFIKPNLKIEYANDAPEDVFSGNIKTYVGEEFDLARNVDLLIKKLMGKGIKIDWEGIATALKKN